MAMRSSTPPSWSIMTSGTTGRAHPVIVIRIKATKRRLGILYNPKMKTFLNGLLAFGIVFMFVYVFVLDPLRKILRARNWMETPCVIISREVEESGSDPGL